MLTLASLSDELLKKWSKSSNFLILQINNDTKIVDSNEYFQKMIKGIEYLETLITYTHKTKFLNNLSLCIKEKSIIKFTTNLSFNSEDVTDIPNSYTVIIEYVNNDLIIVLAEPIPALSHNEARTYFSMINDYSFLSRKLQKLNFNLNKKNEELKEALDKIEFYANYDYLTKIYNRKRVFEELEKEYEKYKRVGIVFTIAMLDIDDFKKINDTFGHQNGDVVLVTFSKKIKSMLRKYDIFARIGGEEFLIIFPSLSSSDGKEIINRVLVEFSKEEIELSNDKKIKVSFSAGIATVEKGLTIDKLIAKADENLYKAKKNGKNQVI